MNNLSSETRPENLPKLIRDIQLQLLMLENETYERYHEMQELKGSHTVAILGEIDESGKRRFSNEANRELELNRRLNEDAAYQTAKKWHSEKMQEKKKMEIEIEYLKNTFEWALAQVRR